MENDIKFLERDVQVVETKYVVVFECCSPFERLVPCGSYVRSVPNRVTSVEQTSLGHTATLQCAQVSLMADLQRYVNIPRFCGM